jgi:hypothetical protein
MVAVLRADVCHALRKSRASGTKDAWYMRESPWDPLSRRGGHRDRVGEPLMRAA